MGRTVTDEAKPLGVLVCHPSSAGDGRFGAMGKEGWL
jgi:hypothetical protein